MSDSRERATFIAGQSGAALISADLPLRANLSVIENIALYSQYHDNLEYNVAADQVWTLLTQVGYSDSAFKRDPDLSPEERFVAKLLRALIAQPAVLIIDRPGMLLPDSHYPPLVESLLARLTNHLNDCWIVDYQWNEPLYAPR